MTIDTNAVVSMTEANRNFSKVTRLAEQKGQTVIFKNNRPKYLLIDLDTSPIVDMTDDEKIDFWPPGSCVSIEQPLRNLPNDTILKGQSLAAAQVDGRGDGRKYWTS